MSDTTPFPGEPARSEADRIAGLFASMNRHRHAGLVIGVALQISVLAGMIATRAAPHVSGETVRLRVMPVDPRDLFRGDYVILSYEFSGVPPAGIAGLSSAPAQARGQTVYVTLVPEPDGVHWRQGEFSVNKPTGAKFLRGRIVGHNRIEFGIESFYVQEGQGRQYEQAVRQRRLCAEVSVGRDGQAGLRKLVIE